MLERNKQVTRQKNSLYHFPVFLLSLKNRHVTIRTSTRSFFYSAQSLFINHFYWKITHGFACMSWDQIGDYCRQAIFNRDFFFVCFCSRLETHRKLSWSILSVVLQTCPQSRERFIRYIQRHPFNSHKIGSLDYTCNFY